MSGSTPTCASVDVGCGRSVASALGGQYTFAHFCLQNCLMKSLFDCLLPGPLFWMGATSPLEILLFFNSSEYCHGENSNSYPARYFLSPSGVFQLQTHVLSAIPTHSPHPSTFPSHAFAISLLFAGMLISPKVSLSAITW